MAKKNNKALFDELIVSLSKTDRPELRLQTLKFINVLIYKAPSEKKKSQFLARLENLGLYDELYQVANECANDQMIVK